MRPKIRGRGRRARIILHDWGSAAGNGFGERADLADDGSLDYDDAPDGPMVPRRGWLLLAGAVCVVALLSPLAVCLATACCGLLLVLRELGRRISLRHRLVAFGGTRRKVGRHRAPRRTLFSPTREVNGPGAPQQRSHFRLRSPAAR